MALNKYIFHRIWFTFVNKIKKKRPFTFAIGTSSLINEEHNLHVPLLDYDFNNIKKVLNDLHKLTYKYQLKDCFIFETRCGFHAIFPYDIMTWEEVESIVWDSKADWRFKVFGRKYGRNFLRVSGKYKKHDIKTLGKSNSPYFPKPEERIIGNAVIKSHKDLFLTHDTFDKGKLYE